MRLVLANRGLVRKDLSFIDSLIDDMVELTFSIDYTSLLALLGRSKMKGFY
jgi:hypothetical protein